jgi:pilus assembly protein Flp/PilA
LISGKEVLFVKADCNHFAGSVVPAGSWRGPLRRHGWHGTGDAAMSRFLRALAADRRGVTAMEYGLIAGVLAVGLVTAFTSLTGRLTNAFNALSF